ncbi:MAG: formylglycine-generating enzyme family protein [Paludibacteraceae bacterium]|nr:formylglycine-generating enzyme family protein [Paludibacteraceae bacterium]
MIKVEGGTFDMMEGDKSHFVTVSDFYVGETPVTQALWYAVMGENPSFFKGENNLPVEQVSWNDCQKFICKLNNLSGKNFRLPTEAEWEYAARGGNKSKGFIYSGSNDPEDVAWFLQNSGDEPLGDKDFYIDIMKWQENWVGDFYIQDIGNLWLRGNCKTHPVKQKQPNELGIYDMSGNVWELCSDRYNKDNYSVSPRKKNSKSI